MSDELDIVFHVLVSQLSRRVIHLWRYQLSIVRSAAERKQSEWDTEPMSDDGLLVVIYAYIMSCKK